MRLGNPLTLAYLALADAHYEITGTPLRAHYVHADTFSRLWAEFYWMQQELLSPGVAAAQREHDGSGSAPTRREIAGIPVVAVEGYLEALVQVPAYEDMDAPKVDNAPG